MYLWGILCALLAGLASQAGHICQKIVVNQQTAAPSGRFFARLLRRPLWVTGLVLELGVSTVFFLLAQVYLGPALIPGLMATGLIVLTAGSAWIVREPLGFSEALGIAFLIAAAALLGMSRLAIDLAAFDIFETVFLKRAGVFTVMVTGLFFALRVPRWGAHAGAGVRTGAGARAGVMHALGSGLLYVLSNFWVGPFTGAVLRLFRGELGLPVWAMFAFTSAVLVLTNLFGIAELQRAFRVSRAAVAAPLQTLPTQIAPSLMYLLVFRLPPPSRGALWMFAAGAALIVASSFLIRSPEARPRTPGTSRGGRRRGSRAPRTPAPAE